MATEHWRAELPGKADKALARRAIAQDRTLSPAAKAVADELIDHFNRKTGRCDPSIRRLSLLTGYGIRTIYAALRELERAGTIRRRRHGGGSQTNAYEINWRQLVERVPGRRKTHEEFDRGAGAKKAYEPGEEICTQTIEGTIEDQPLARVAENSSISRSVRRRSHSVVAGNRKPNKRTPSSSQVMRNKALQRWEIELREALGSEGYEAVLSRLTTDLIERATDAEAEHPGSGCRVVLKAFGSG